MKDAIGSDRRSPVRSLLGKLRGWQGEGGPTKRLAAPALQTRLSLLAREGANVQGSNYRYPLGCVYEHKEGTEMWDSRQKQQRTKRVVGGLAGAGLNGVIPRHVAPSKFPGVNSACHIGLISKRTSSNLSTSLSSLNLTLVV